MADSGDLALTYRGLRLGYADPPYIGCAHLYADHPDFAGEVDHAALIERLESEFDGWVLHASATPASMAVLAPLVAKTGARWMSWVKGFAAFKKNVSVAYAWEPVIIKPARKPVVSKRLVMRDWIQESITLRRGLTGAKPEAVCHWAFEVLGARPEDHLSDLFPGSGAVSRAWSSWQMKFALPPCVAMPGDVSGSDSSIPETVAPGPGSPPSVSSGDQKEGVRTLAASDSCADDHLQNQPDSQSLPGSECSHG